MQTQPALHANRLSTRSLVAAAALALSALWTLSAVAEHLFFVEFEGDGLGGITTLAGASDVAVSADGLCVFATADVDHALTAFERSIAAAELTFDESHVDDEDGEFGLLAASSVVATPDGRHVYVTGGVDDSLLVYRRDATSDSLVFVAAQAKENNVGGVVGLDGATSVAVSTDSQFVYVAASLDDAVSVFRRDATTDALTFVEAEFDGAGATGLDGASDVAASPDQQHVYVTGRVDDAVSLFQRQPGGGLSHVDTYFDGAGDIEGLDGASGVAVSPEGGHVYVVGAYANSLVTFQRNPFTGALSFRSAVYDGEGDVDGLGGASDVAVSPLGDRVYVAAKDDDAVALFRRTPATGELVFLDALMPGVGLRGARSVATRDGMVVYAAAHADDGVAGIYVALCDGDEGLGDSDSDAICDDLDQCLGDDFSGDGDFDDVCDDLDACQGADDADDADADTVPDGCDQCEGDDASGDSDFDDVCDDLDECPGFDDDVDGDGDGVADGCDDCAGNDAAGDSDGDDVCDNLDICPGSDDNADADADRIPDGCDDLLRRRQTGRRRRRRRLRRSRRLSGFRRRRRRRRRHGARRLRRLRRRRRQRRHRRRPRMRRSRLRARRSVGLRAGCLRRMRRYRHRVSDLLRRLRIGRYVGLGAGDRRGVTARL